VDTKSIIVTIFAVGRERRLTMGYEDEANARRRSRRARLFRHEPGSPAPRALFRSKERKTVTLEERFAAVEQELADIRGFRPPRSG